jgi:uncharacterized protein YbaR (Trm112 family)
VLPPELLAVLVCPKSKQPLIYFPRGADDEGEAHGFLLCPASHLRYPVHDGVPVMLVEEATDVAPADLAVLISRARQLGLGNLPA